MARINLTQFLLCVLEYLRQTRLPCTDSHGCDREPTELRFPLQPRHRPQQLEFQLVHRGRPGHGSYNNPARLPCTKLLKALRLLFQIVDSREANDVKTFGRTKDVVFRRSGLIAKVSWSSSLKISSSE